MFSIDPLRANTFKAAKYISLKLDDCLCKTLMQKKKLKLI